VRWTLVFAMVAACTIFPGLAAEDVPVPEACTKAVNTHLAQLLTARPKETTDNVMACGVTTGSSHTQRGRKHGAHQIIPLLVTMPDGSTRPVEVVTNDELDGKITAKKGDKVIAYGQVFFDNLHGFSAGIHDVHCSTHKGANNGWVVVNGVKFPNHC
jgi:hypothetical protein